MKASVVNAMRKGWLCMAPKHECLHHDWILRDWIIDLENSWTAEIPCANYFCLGDITWRSYLKYENIKRPGRSLSANEAAWCPGHCLSRWISVPLNRQHNSTWPQAIGKTAMLCTSWSLWNCGCFLQLNQSTNDLTPNCRFERPCRSCKIFEIFGRRIPKNKELSAVRICFWIIVVVLKHCSWCERDFEALENKWNPKRKQLVLRAIFSLFRFNFMVLGWSLLLLVTTKRPVTGLRIEVTFQSWNKSSFQPCEAWVIACRDIRVSLARTNRMSSMKYLSSRCLGISCRLNITLSTRKKPCSPTMGLSSGTACHGKRSSWSDQKCLAPVERWKLSGRHEIL